MDLHDCLTIHIMKTEKASHIYLAEFLNKQEIEMNRPCLTTGRQSCILSCEETTEASSVYSYIRNFAASRIFI